MTPTALPSYWLAPVHATLGGDHGEHVEAFGWPPSFLRPDRGRERDPDWLRSAARQWEDSTDPEIAHAAHAFLRLALALLGIALPASSPEEAPANLSTDPRPTWDSHPPPPGHPSTRTRQLLAAPAAPPQGRAAASA